MAEEESTSIVRLLIDGVKVLFAMSPLIALAFIIYSGFENEEEEKRKLSKKTDFQLEGHAE